MQKSQLPAICGICPYGCHVKVTLSDGRIVDVKANSDSPYGNLCPKGKRAPQVVYSPDRVQKPLIRNGKKGSVSYREANWDEALELIENAFKRVKKRYGAAAAASYMGGGTLEDSLSLLGDSFLQPFGSPNDMDCGSICYVSSRVIAPLTTLGIENRNLIPDYENAEAVVIWGTNPANGCLPDRYRRILEAKKRGAQVIVVDPRLQALANVADIWVPIRPGTDGAFVLGVLNIVIQKGWYDKQFVNNMTVGFEEFRNYAQKFTPERVAATCHIEKQMVLQMAEILTKNSTTLNFYTGLEYASSAVQNTRALYILWALTGNIDVRGGLYIDEYSCEPVMEHPLPEGCVPIGAREYPVFYALTGKGQFIEFPRAVLYDDPYPARALIIIGGSPFLSYPQPELWRKVYEGLEFLVVVDRFFTSEARWADVILPAVTYYEIASFQYYKDRICLRRKVIEPVGEAMNDLLIIARIADRLGYGHLFPQNEKDIFERAFADNPGVLQTLTKTVPIEQGERHYRKYESGRLRSDGRPGFPTHSGKLEIQSSLLAKYGYDALPIYTDPYQSSGKMGEYPFALTTGARNPFKYNSQYLNIPDLVKHQPEPVLEINPIDALSCSIRDGDPVWVKTANGKIKLTAYLTENICPGALHAPYGGGNLHQDDNWKEANINILLSLQSRDPISGYITCKAVPCALERAY